MFRRIAGLALPLLLLLTMPVSRPVRAADLTLDEIVAKHVEARGGAERWAGLGGLEIRGAMSYLSQTGPFTAWVGPDGRYRLESKEHGRTLITGFDGETAWRASDSDPGAVQRIRGVERAMVARDADFPTPLFHAKEKGYDLQLKGKQDRDGTPVIAIEVAREDGYAETWYLDPQTFLDVGRDSPGSRFGDLVPMRTYHDDFRTVAGVKVPFRIENQWNVQDRVFVVESVDVAGTLEDARFRPPKPAGMEPLEALVGEWRVVSSAPLHAGAPWRDSERSSTIDARLNGALLEERFTTSSGQDVVRSYTYDRFRKRYRITEISETSSYLDIEEGAFDESDRLVLSNVATGTPMESGGHTVHIRTTLSEITTDGFRVDREISMDGGASWSLAAKSTYHRRDPAV